jgi:riboflavin synthase
MFTGLIEHVGTIRDLGASGEVARLRVELGPLADGTRLGDSIAINGVCLTVTALDGPLASFDAVPETMRRTNLGELRPGARVNLELALLPTQRLGGHFVQGHVDGVARLERVESGPRWQERHFLLEDAALATQIVSKGSIALDGISLTVAGCDPSLGTFWVALIPETLARTTFGEQARGARVNVETDILGKYVQAFLVYGTARPAANSSNITEAWLREHGYGG